MSEQALHTAMTPQQRELSQGGFAAYKEFAVGNDASFLYFLWYEFLTTCFSGLPGALGLGTRAVLYPTLFGSCAGRQALGRGVVVRHPRSISMGSRVLVDDYAVLDVRGSGAITLGDHVSIGRFTTIAAKNGQISLSAGANIGSYCRIATQSQVSIGKSVLVGAYSYIGAGNHQPGDGSRALIEQPMDIKGGVTIGDNAWIGAGAMIVDGVTIGEGAIIGAQSLVRDSVAPHTVVAGTPARVIQAKGVASC